MWHNYITVVSLHLYNKCSTWFLDIRIYQLVAIIVVLIPEINRLAVFANTKNTSFSSDSFSNRFEPKCLIASLGDIVTDIFPSDNGEIQMSISIHTVNDLYGMLEYQNLACILKNFKITVVHTLSTVTHNSNLSHAHDSRVSTCEMLCDTCKIFLITPHVYLLYYL